MFNWDNLYFEMISLFLKPIIYFKIEMMSEMQHKQISEKLTPHHYFPLVFLFSKF